jgi:hypothetical protein
LTGVDLKTVEIEAWRLKKGNDEVSVRIVGKGIDIRAREDIERIIERQKLKDTYIQVNNK